MNNVSVHRTTKPADTATALRRLPARLARAIDRTLFAHRIRYDLDELSDRLRRDVGLTRG